MAISVRGITNNSGSPVTSLSVTPVVGTTTGDLVVVLATRNAAINGSETVVDNNGATPFTKEWFGTDTSNGADMSIFYRRIQSGDPASYSFSYNSGGGSTFSLICITFQDPDPTTVFDVAPSNATDTFSIADGGSANAVDVTSLVTGSVHIIIALRNTDHYSNTPSGYTQLNGVGSTHEGFRGVYKVLAGAGATGVVTLTGPNSRSALLQSFIVKSSAASGHAYPLSGKLYSLLGGKIR